jgi:hypothetical protein
MNCANHPDVAASQYCRTCGKPLCAACVRNVQGVAYCEQCLAERLGAVQPPLAANTPYVAPPIYSVQPIAASGPNPALAGILAGFFPFGVGAVYTGQYAKGLAHLVIITLMIWGETVSNSDGLSTILGLGIAFFYIYQIIDAIKSAHAIRAGQPAPDPFGLAGMFGGWESRTQASASQNAAAQVGVPIQGGAVPQQQRIPTVAIVLIALGCLFLLRTAGIFDYDEDLIWPVVLIGLGVFMVIRRRNAIEGIDERGRRIRMRLTGPVVLITSGTLILIEHLHGPGFHRTWPLILLAIGLVRLLDSNNPNSWNAGCVPPPPSAPMPPGTQAGAGSSSGPTTGSEVNRG